MKRKESDHDESGTSSQSPDGGSSKGAVSVQKSSVNKESYGRTGSNPLEPRGEPIFHNPGQPRVPESKKNKLSDRDTAGTRIVAKWPRPKVYRSGVSSSQGEEAAKRMHQYATEIIDTTR